VKTCGRVDSPTTSDTVDLSSLVDTFEGGVSAPPFFMERLAVPVQAWIALVFGLVSMMGSTLWAVVAITRAVARALTKFEIIGAQQANEIKEIKDSVNKFGDVISLVAVQKEEIRSLRETESQNTRRTDETFTRIFARLDNLQR
jgi:hypothetical protein